MSIDKKVQYILIKNCKSLPMNLKHFIFFTGRKVTYEMVRGG